MQERKHLLDYRSSNIAEFDYECSIFSNGDVFATTIDGISETERSAHGTLDVARVTQMHRELLASAGRFIDERRAHDMLEGCLMIAGKEGMRFHKDFVDPVSDEEVGAKAAKTIVVDSNRNVRPMDRSLDLCITGSIRDYGKWFASWMRSEKRDNITGSLRYYPSGIIALVINYTQAPKNRRQPADNVENMADRCIMLEHLQEHCMTQETHEFSTTVVTLHRDTGYVVLAYGDTEPAPSFVEHGTTIRGVCIDLCSEAPPKKFLEP